MAKKELDLEALKAKRAEIIAETEKRLADLFGGLAEREEEAAAELREVSALLIEAGLTPKYAVVGYGSASGGKKSGGKRTRATAEELAQRTEAIAAALKGTKKGKGLSISAIAEKAGLDASHVRPILGKMKADKAVAMEGSKVNATYYGT